MSSLDMIDVSYAYPDEVDRFRTRKRCQVTVDDIPEEDLVLKHLNLHVDDGEFLCLVGHSGCGKSTTLRILAGLQKPLGGKILIGDEPLDGPGMNRSIVFQNYSIFPWMRVKQNVEFGIHQASKELHRGLTKERIAEIADEYLAKVNMTKAADLYPYQLSGGMKQRAAIARALAMDTEILLFDEPFGALDIKTRRELQGLMEGLWMADEACDRKRKTAIFVTHDIEEALLLADRIVFMSGGRFVDQFRVDVPRPRDPEIFFEMDVYKERRAYLLELFYAAEETRLDEAERERVYEEVV